MWPSLTYLNGFQTGALCGLIPLSSLVPSFRPSFQQSSTDTSWQYSLTTTVIHSRQLQRPKKQKSNHVNFYIEKWKKCEKMNFKTISETKRLYYKQKIYKYNMAFFSALQSRKPWSPTKVSQYVWVSQVSVFIIVLHYQHRLFFIISSPKLICVLLPIHFGCLSIPLCQPPPTLPISFTLTRTNFLAQLKYMSWIRATFN